VTIPPADTGTSATPRLEVRDCQIDAVLLESYSGAALILVNLTETPPASAVVHGSRMRCRFPRGEAAMSIWLDEACVTGNIFANQIAVPAQPSQALPNSFSLTILGVLTPLGAVAMAVSGNVLIDPPVLPPQQLTALNTVVGYSEVPAVAAISPPNGTAGQNVTITGTGFTAATGVNFGPNNATAMTINSDTQISATCPQGSGTVDVRVTTPAGTSPISDADHFSYIVIG
jgi:hypothetical protein